MSWLQVVIDVALSVLTDTPYVPSDGGWFDRD
jgi:hypothetical protein